MSLSEELEQAIDIVDLVGRYAKLKKTGTSYKALCPFPGHSEKTPSFVVSPVKQIAYCFGCHKGGGPLKFLMDIENCEFREAMQMLGSITGREVQWFIPDPQKAQLQKNLYGLYKDATQYYKSALEKNPEIKKYLFDRGLSSEDIENFHFGYADSGQNLYNFLKEKWYDDTLIAESHIFLDIKARKDKFIGRVIFPIQNLRGDFVAFAGRIVGKGEPKYLNSPASEIYDKSAILYGLYTARSAITKKDQIIITEGYMDTIALHRAGFLQTVAVSGTALTEKHITILKRLTHKIYLCFDSDAAGEQATRASLELLKNNGLEVRIIIIDWAKDPDEYLEKGGNFQDLIDTALSPIAFLIKKNKYNLQSIDEKKKFLQEILEIVRNYSDSIEQDNYLKEVAHISDTPLKIIYELFQKRDTPQKKAQKNESQLISPEDILFAYVFENTNYKKEILAALIFPEWLSARLKKLLETQEDIFQNLPLEEKEKYKALAFQIFEKSLTSEEHIQNLQKMCEQINRSCFKELSETYKQEMKTGNETALIKYSDLLKKAKEYNIK